METTDQEKIKDLGRSVKNYDDKIWSGCRQVVVYRALMAKFKQNEELRKKLLETRDAILAECAHDDITWGIGRHITDERRLDPKQWNGQNLLGYSLMEVRDQLKSEMPKKPRQNHIVPG